MDTAVWHSGSHSKPLYPHIFTCRCSSQKSMVWFKALGPCYITDTGSSLGLFLQPWVHRTNPHPVLQQIADGVDVGVGQHNTTLVWGLSTCRGCQPAISPCPHHQAECSSVALASSPLALMSKGQGQSFCFWVLRVGSPAPTLSGSSLWGAGATLSSAAGDEGGEGSSDDLRASSSTCLGIAGSVRASLLAHAASWRWAIGQLPHSHNIGAGLLNLRQQGQSATQVEGPIPSAATGKGDCQLPGLPQVAGSREQKPFYVTQIPRWMPLFSVFASLWLSVWVLYAFTRMCNWSETAQSKVGSWCCKNNLDLGFNVSCVMDDRV